MLKRDVFYRQKCKANDEIKSRDWGKKILLTDLISQFPCLRFNDLGF